MNRNYLRRNRGLRAATKPNYETQRWEFVSITCPEHGSLGPVDALNEACVALDRDPAQRIALRLHPVK